MSLNDEKRIDILTKSVEKLVRLNDEQDKIINELKNKLCELEKKIDKYSDNLSIIQSDIKLTKLNGDAKNELYNYMQEVKDLPAFETVLTKQEIQELMNNKFGYHDRDHDHDKD